MMRKLPVSKILALRCMSVGDLRRDDQIENRNTEHLGTSSLLEGMPEDLSLFEERRPPFFRLELELAMA